MGAKANPLDESFLDIFRFVVARTEHDQSRVFSLRHRVFCEELDFFSSSVAAKVEQDVYDEHSIHCLVEHRDTGLVVGCLRVVMAGSSESAVRKLPVENYCRDLGVALEIGSLPVTRERLCEISRVAIPRCFRTGNSNDTHITENERALFGQLGRAPFLMLGVSLNLCATAMSGIVGRYHALAMMEPRFQRFLARAGIRFSRVSPVVQLLGQRAAFYIDQRDAEQQMNTEVRPFYTLLRRDLEPQCMGMAS